MKQTLVSNDPFIKAYKKEIKKFKNEIKIFCRDRGVKASLYNFFSYRKKNSIMPENIGTLLSGTFLKSYAITNADFWRAINTLPSDFKNDILMYLNIRRKCDFLRHNTDFRNMLKREHKTKYFNVFTIEGKKK